MNTYAKSLLFLFSAGILAVGAYIVLNSDFRLPKLRGGAAASGPISCDFNGVTYQEGQARASGDGCNTCVCTETGWSCTRNACFDDGTSGIGTVSGALAKVDGVYVTDRVCAVNLLTEKRVCTQVLEHAPSYSMRLPEGSYWIYAEDGSREDGYKAYHSEAVVCRDGACTDHSPVQVDVKEGEISEVQPIDWAAPGWIEKVSVTPSQRKYESYYHKPGATLNVRARNMASVEFFYLFIKLTAQDHDDNPKSVGKAELVRTDENGWQYWELPVPEGFASSKVWPIGTDTEGHVMRGWDLGRSKPDVTLEEKLD